MSRSSSQNIIISKPIDGNILIDKNGSGLALEKLPKWFNTINSVLTDENQGLDKDSDEVDDQEKQRAGYKSN